MRSFDVAWTKLHCNLSSRPICFIKMVYRRKEKFPHRLHLLHTTHCPFPNVKFINLQRCNRISLLRTEEKLIYTRADTLHFYGTLRWSVRLLAGALHQNSNFDHSWAYEKHSPATWLNTVSLIITINVQCVFYHYTLDCCQWLLRDVTVRQRKTTAR